MKKQKSSTIVLTEFSSSDDESEKAMPKIDKEELRKYLKNSDDEESSQITPKTTPKRGKNVKRLKTPSIEGSPIIKPKKLIQKDSSKNILPKVMISKNSRKRQKNLVPHLYSIPKEKIINT